MGDRKPTVIVTFARYRIALTLMRSLARAGACVIAADSCAWPLGRFSRYAQRSFQYRDPFESPDLFVEDLIQAAQRFGATLIMPAFTETQVLARHIPRLRAAGLDLILPAPEAVRLADDKGLTTQHAAALGLAVPQTIYPKSLEHALENLQAYPYPLIVKGRGGKAGEGQRVVTAPAAFEAAYRAVWAETDPQPGRLPIIQQFIDGPSIGAGFLYRDGALLAAGSFEVLRSFRRVHSVLRQSRHFPAAIAAGEALLSSLHWHGIAEIDFILDHKTGTPYLLEINPRFWGSVRNLIDAGIDLPRYLLAMHRGLPIGPVPAQREDIRSLWVYPYLLSCAEALLNGNFRALRQHLINPFRTGTRFDDLSLRDPLPSLVEPFLGLASLLRNGTLALDGRRSPLTESEG